MEGDSEYPAAKRRKMRNGGGKATMVVDKDKCGPTEKGAASQNGMTVNTTDLPVVDDGYSTPLHLSSYSSANNLEKIIRSGYDRHLIPIRQKREADFKLRIETLQAEGKMQKAKEEEALLIEWREKTIMIGSVDEMEAISFFWDEVISFADGEKGKG